MKGVFSNCPSGLTPTLEDKVVERILGVVPSDTCRSSEPILIKGKGNGGPLDRNFDPSLEATGSLVQGLCTNSGRSWIAKGQTKVSERKEFQDSDFEEKQF